MSQIVIDARELRTSSGRYVERLLHYLQKIDKTNDYLVLLKPADIEGWEPSGSNFKKVPCPHKEFTFDEQIGMKRQIEELKADLVHFTFAQQPIWYKGKSVTTFHDLTTLRFTNPDKNWLTFKVKQRIYAYAVMKAAHRSLRVITPSQFVKDDLVHFTGIDPGKIAVTYEAADMITDAPEPVSGLERGKFLMYVGRPTPHKNLERLIEAFGILSRDRPELKLVLGGKMDNNYSQLEEHVRSTGIGNIVFTGLLSEGQLRWLYENCSAYVFPSLSEGFGLPGLEAMVHGAPVISSDVTSLPEIYRDAAQYFDPGDTKDMVRAMGEVLDGKELREKLIREGYNLVKQYSWEKMAEQTLEVYREVLGSS